LKLITYEFYNQEERGKEKSQVWAAASISNHQSIPSSQNVVILKSMHKVFPGKCQFDEKVQSLQKKK